MLSSGGPRFSAFGTPYPVRTGSFGKTNEAIEGVEPQVLHWPVLVIDSANERVEIIEQVRVSGIFQIAVERRVDRTLDAIMNAVGPIDDAAPSGSTTASKRSWAKWYVSQIRETSHRSIWPVMDDTAPVSFVTI